MSTETTATKQDILDSQKEITDVIQDLIVRFDARFKDIDREIVDLKASHDKLINTIDAIIKRYDDMDVENAARDSQFQKLLSWARKVSEKTGIPLENL